MTESPAPIPARQLALLALVYVGVSMLSYQPALSGGFVSDDALVVGVNPYVQELSVDNLVAVFDPTGPAILYSLNYAPIHMILVALERTIFGDAMLGYHLVNIALHVITTLLIVMLWVSTRMPLWTAAAAGAVFAAHPANAEAVVMIFQSKTLFSTALALGAVLAFWKRPVLSLALFSAALLTKIAAAFALPMLAVWFWLRRGETGATLPSAGWLIGWGVVLGLVAIPEYAAFARIGEHTVPLGESAVSRTQTVIAIAGRYLVMAASGTGVSASHSPDAVTSWLDPWWLGGLAGLALLAWRMIRSLVRREVEAVWWIAAVAAFAPISQIFPFQYPIADRYLYNVLPGLLGGCLLAAISSVGWARERIGADQLEKWKHAPVAALAALALLFAGLSHSRSPVFLSDEALLNESARNYENGINAWVIQFAEGANTGDPRQVREALRALEARGFYSFKFFDQGLVGPSARDPESRAIVRRMAELYVERYEALEPLHQLEVRLLGDAYLVAGRPADARDAAQRALEIGGPHDGEARELLRQARLALHRKRAGGR
jgi:hypothetical protein